MKSVKLVTDARFMIYYVRALKSRAWKLDAALFLMLAKAYFVKVAASCQIYRQTTMNVLRVSFHKCSVRNPFTCRVSLDFDVIYSSSTESCVSKHIYKNT